MKNKFEKINTSRLKIMIQGDDLVADFLILLVENLKKDVTKVKQHLEKKEFEKERTNFIEQLEIEKFPEYVYNKDIEIVNNSK